MTITELIQLAEDCGLRNASVVEDSHSFEFIFPTTGPNPTDLKLDNINHLINAMTSNPDPENHIFTRQEDLGDGEYGRVFVHLVIYKDQ